LRSSRDTSGGLEVVELGQSAQKDEAHPDEVVSVLKFAENSVRRDGSDKVCKWKGEKEVNEVKVKKKYK
jgi:hypothetical protein